MRITFAIVCLTAVDSVLHNNTNVTNAVRINLVNQETSIKNDHDFDQPKPSLTSQTETEAKADCPYTQPVPVVEAYPVAEAYPMTFWDRCCIGGNSLFDRLLEGLAAVPNAIVDTIRPPPYVRSSWGNPIDVNGVALLTN